MIHPFPCLITFNIVGYITERELNKSCGVSSICNQSHIELHLICVIVVHFAMPCIIKPGIILVCASCHVYVVVVYYVVCLFPGCFSRQLRFCSTMSVCLLHGLVLLPCGISGKMTIPSKSLLSLLASCSLYCYATLPTTCYIMPPILPCQASNPPFLANCCLAMLPLLLSPSYSVVSCR